MALPCPISLLGAVIYSNGAWIGLSYSTRSASDTFTRCLKRVLECD